MQQEYVFTGPFVEKQTKTTKMKTKTSQMESLDCQKPNNKTFKRKKTIEALAERGMGAFFVFVCFATVFGRRRESEICGNGCCVFDLS